MKAKPILISILIYLPSVLLAVFYVPTALDKLLDPHQTGKIVQSSAVMLTAGIFILTGLALFYYHKTMLWGVTMLSLYMLAVIGIHLYKGKPAEVLMLILMSTLFAAYIRKPEVFERN